MGGTLQDRMRSNPPPPSLSQSTFSLLKGRMKLNMRRHAVSATFSMFAQWTPNSRGARKSGNRKIGFRPDERRENQNPQCNPSIHGAISLFFSRVHILSPISTLDIYPHPKKKRKKVYHDARTAECVLHPSQKERNKIFFSLFLRVKKPHST